MRIGLRRIPALRQLIVQNADSGQRLDRYLGRYFCDAPKSFVYRMLRKKNIVLNGRKASGDEVLSEGDEIRLWLAEDTIAKFTAKTMDQANVPETGGYPVTDLDILYEDEHVILINKPAGMLSQKASPEDVSLCEYLIGYLISSGKMKPEQLRTVRPSVCNRLDRNTSGIVCCGKTIAGLAALSELFRSRDVHKYYLAVVMGRIDREERLEGFLLKDERANKARILGTAKSSARGQTLRREGVRAQDQEDAKHVCTIVRPLHPVDIHGRSATLIEAQLITGRSHQIRSQLAARGHVLVGDVKYAAENEKTFFIKKAGQKVQLLHCTKMVFPDLTGVLAPLGGKTILAQPPERFCRLAGIPYDNK